MAPIPPVIRRKHRVVTRRRVAPVAVAAPIAPAPVAVAAPIAPAPVAVAAPVPEKPENKTAAMQILKEHWAELPDEDLDFAKSLVEQHTKSRRLSDRQWPWVLKLAHRIANKEVKPDADPAQEQAIQILRDGVDTLLPGDMDFAKSLITQYEKRGCLSSFQWPWISRLTGRIIISRAGNIGDTSALFDLFKKTDDHLRSATVTVPFHGEPLRIFRNNVGGFNVFRGDHDRIGLIGQDGSWTAALSIIRDGEEANVMKILKKLISNPLDTLAEYGKLSGRCCYCWLILTDKRSTAMGYGPICAKHWSLPWGKKLACDGDVMSPSQ